MFNRLGRVLYWGVWPGSWLYLRWSRRARLVLLCGDEVLVVNNWLGAGKWNLPGGGLHKSEDPRLGLLRELKEETGVGLQPDRLELLRTELYRVHGFRYMCDYFVARVADKPTTTRQRFEIIDIAWTKCSDITPKTHGPDVIRGLQLLDSR